MKLQEGDLEFDFSDAMKKPLKFDDGATHASSSIQPVDFVVEYEKCIRFIEVKDPDLPGADNVEAFKEKLKSGKLIRSLAGKYRDSLFFRTFQGNPQKEIEYIVLLSMKALDDALLVTKQDELSRSIPIHHQAWNRRSAAAFAILNIEQWKKRFGSNSIRRLSETAEQTPNAGNIEKE